VSRSPDSRPSSDRRQRLVAWATFTLVTVFGLALLWPVPAGHMPLSADHTVHLTRAYLTAEQLSQGRLAGWSSTWFFGFPVGELYPQLGDLLIIAVHGLSLGLLDWWSSYALGFSLVFVCQGWAMLRTGKALGLGRAPGLIAACLLLADPGMYREGGWAYTVGYGVWPQAFATALTWWGFGELALAWREGSTGPRIRGLARASLVLGAALLAHPMSLPMIAMGAPLFVACMGLRGGGLRRHLGATTLTVALAIALAAYWLVPMLAHRAWMASYGWPFTSLQNMMRRALEGQWTTHMPPAAGYLATAGLLWAAIAGRGFFRFVAAFALASWVFASNDVWWTLRLDRVSEGFSHLQYQRFLLSAKPGLYLAAGATIGLAATHARRVVEGHWRPNLAPRLRGATAALALVFSVGAIAWTTIDAADAARENEVGKVQIERRPGSNEFEADYQAFMAWAREQRMASDEFYRIAVRAGRNAHWFMDSPVITETATYKVGFTPGDNFVHKPESDEKPVLDRLRVRYMVRPGRDGGSLRDEVARFGKIAVVERPIVAEIASTDAGELEILEDAADEGRVRVQLRGAGSGTRLEFAVAGHPRWQLTRDGEPVEWVEVPVFGNAAPATLEERRAGALRGGKADGDDGSEPTLIGVLDATDGEYVLEYRYRRWFDWLAALASWIALIVCTLAAIQWERLAPVSARVRDWLARALASLDRVTHPALVAGAVLAIAVVLGVRWTRAADEEARFAVGWMLDGRARDVRGMRAAPFKADMLIRSAVRVRARRKGPATVTFPAVSLTDRLEGWVALDDDAAKVRAKGRHRLVVDARPHDGGEWTTLGRLTMRHRANGVPLSFETGELAGQSADVRVTFESTGKSPPPIAFDLELDPAEGVEP
jgi:hypothetical protein